MEGFDEVTKEKENEVGTIMQCRENQTWNGLEWVIREGKDKEKEERKERIRKKR